MLDMVPGLPVGTRLKPAVAFALVGSIIELALFASATPTPLYGIYQAEWGFSTLVLTLVYAIYPLGVLASLLTVGRISDDLGRRPVLAASLIGLIPHRAALPGSVGWLFAARGLQGLTTGVALGAAGAALLDFQPNGDGRRAGLVNGVASAAGIGAGGIVAATLAQYAADPLVDPFVLLLVLVAVALARNPPPPRAGPAHSALVCGCRPRASRARRAGRSPSRPAASGLVVGRRRLPRPQARSPASSWTPATAWPAARRSSPCACPPPCPNWRLRL